MKNLIKFTLATFCFGLAITSVQAAFTSLYVFGDSLSTTTSNMVAYPASANYYGHRYSNGRVWVEVLAQQQGVPYFESNNISYFGNTSSNLVNEVLKFTPPVDPKNALVVIWVNNADMFYPALDPNPTLAKFTNVFNVALTNQYKSITNLYAKGIRMLVMPNVVDISTVPQFNTYTSQTNLLRKASINYNSLFYAMLDKARANCPGLIVVVPDYFALLSNLIANPDSYGVTNALYAKLSIDALDDPSLINKSVNGPGANYIFWDYLDPTAKVHYWMASLAQQLISPVQISQLVNFSGSNRLDVANLPLGMNGVVEGSTNLLGGWVAQASFTSTNSVQSVFVPVSTSPGTLQVAPKDLTPPGDSTGLAFFPPQLYRLKFPVVWVWP